VSSDHRLQRSVQKRRGTFTDSEDFAQELERRGPISDEPRSESPPHRAHTDEMEIEHWLREFREIPNAPDFARDIESESSITQADVARIREEIDRQDAAASKRRKSTK
jgi:hypothetical protein